MKYKKYITQEGKNEILKIAFANEGTENTFKYLAIGYEGSKASSTGKAEDFHELDLNAHGYQRISGETDSKDSNQVTEDGTITISFVMGEDNYNQAEEAGTEITEIALCNSADGTLGTEACKCFAFCEVPPIKKTYNVSLKYTLKISIE